MSDTGFDKDYFIQRLLEIRRRENLRNWAEFERRINMLGAVHRWKTGKDKPTPDSLMKIAQAFNVPLDYLINPAYDKKHLPDLREYRPETYDARPHLVDVELIAGVVAEIVRCLREYRLRIGDKRLGRIIALGYEQCAVDRIKPEELDVKALLVLTATISD